jgi:hypothetical protein
VNAGDRTPVLISPPIPGIADGVGLMGLFRADLNP